jgi:hypothetical protein
LFSGKVCFNAESSEKSAQISGKKNVLQNETLFYSKAVDADIAGSLPVRWYSSGSKD